MKTWLVVGGIVLIGAAIYQGFLRGDTVQVDREVLIAESLADKLAGWQQRRDEACRKKAMQVAIGVADSMILAYAREQKLLLNRPSRPLRPEEPPLLRPNDTLQLAPFLGDTLAL